MLPRNTKVICKGSIYYVFMCYGHFTLICDKKTKFKDIFLKKINIKEVKTSNLIYQLALF